MLSRQLKTPKLVLLVLLLISLLRAVGRSDLWGGGGASNNPKQSKGQDFASFGAKIWGSDCHPAPQFLQPCCSSTFRVNFLLPRIDQIVNITDLYLYAFIYVHKFLAKLFKVHYMNFFVHGSLPLGPDFFSEILNFQM